MQKNIAGQKWTVFAFGGASHTAPGDPITGDAANITAQLSQDGGVLAGLTDVNPIELGGGYYEFDITQAESNADKLAIVPVSATPNVLVVGSPGSLYTAPANHPDTVISSTGNIDARLAADVTHGGGTQTRFDMNNSAGSGDAMSAHAGGDNHAFRLIAAAGDAFRKTSADSYADYSSGGAAGWRVQGSSASPVPAAVFIGSTGGGHSIDLTVFGGGYPIDYDDTDLLAAIWTHDEAGRLMEGARQLRPFVVGAAPSASTIPTDITGAPYTTVDHFKGRVVTINEETKSIIGSSGSPVVLTVSDFVSVPSQNDLGVIS